MSRDTLVDGSELYIYRDTMTGKRFAREVGEFDETGRFEMVFPATPGDPTFREEEREEIARILGIVAENQLKLPRDLDGALDAIEQVLKARLDPHA